MIRKIISFLFVIILAAVIVRIPFVQAGTMSAPDEPVLFIVDFSNSMSEKFQGVRKIDMHMDTVNELLPQIPESKKLGLRVYGHKMGVTPIQACRASALKVPIQEGSATLIQKTLTSLKPTGWTPITYSLKQAVANDFKGYEDKKKRIVLLSDGGENCDESPCDYVMHLMKTRDDISIDVIAFAVDDTEAGNQLKCTALVTSGKFHRADTAAELKRSLSDTLDAQKEVEGRILLP